MSTEGPDLVTVPGLVPGKQRVPMLREGLQVCHRSVLSCPLGHFSRDHDRKFWGPALEGSDDTRDV